MPPGSETALDAASKRGYEALLMAIVLLACIGLVGMLIRWFVHSMDTRLKEGIDREARLAQRITTLETFVESTLLKLVNDVSTSLQHNTETMAGLTRALEARPCLLHDKLPRAE